MADGNGDSARNSAAHILRRMTLRQIEGFLAAADLLSFTRAAQRLNMSQPAFSQLIRELEAGIDLKLFERTTRRVNLTPAGDALHSKLRKSVLGIFDAYEDACAVARAERGRFAVGTLQSLAVGLVIQSLAEFRRQSPGITVSLHEDYNGALIEQVERGDVDFAVCAYKGASEGMVFDDLFDEELVLILPVTSPLSRRPSCGWKALQSQSLILTTKHSSTREQIEDAFKINNIITESVYDVVSMFTALKMVREGFGLTILPFTVLDEINMAGLTSCQLVSPTPVRRIGICRRTDRTLSPAAAGFKALLERKATTIRSALGQLS